MQQDEKREQLIVRNKTYQKSNELINAMGKGTALSQKLFAIGMQHIVIDETNNGCCDNIRGSDLTTDVLIFNSRVIILKHIEALCDSKVKRDVNYF
ncbi:hypothetical protein [Butyrivibrio sp. FCS014]|uniref:hypothetical protein n=1 Tax=Butyrivibrio sp. FCS014 TaxID=1408304 RepID=UPI0004B55248|nr:hypothetical protein [Butyrivibrio sp. FCS014]